MVSRPGTMLICLLIGFGQTLVALCVTAHADQHQVDKERMVEHAHDHDHLPHHEHDERGDPRPVKPLPDFCPPRPASQDPGLTGPVVGTQIDHLSSQALPQSCLAYRLPLGLRARSPSVPAPGGLLPLLL